MTDADVDALKAKYPGRELVALSSSGGAEVVAVLPQAADLAVFREKLQDRKLAASAMEGLVVSCIVYPDRDKLREIVNRKPLLIEKWYQRLEKEIGGAEEIELKKL